PPRLLEALTRPPRRGPAVAAGGLVPVNQRHDAWVRFASYLHNVGLSADQKVPVMLALRDAAFEQPAEETEYEAREIAKWCEDKEMSRPITRQQRRSA